VLSLVQSIPDGSTSSLPGSVLSLCDRARHIKKLRTVTNPVTGHNTRLYPHTLIHRQPDRRVQRTRVPDSRVWSVLCPSSTGRTRVPGSVPRPDRRVPGCPDGRGYRVPDTRVPDEDSRVYPAFIAEGIPRLSRVYHEGTRYSGGYTEGTGRVHTRVPGDHPAIRLDRIPRLSRVYPIQDCDATYQENITSLSDRIGGLRSRILSGSVMG
jgi:hypothetical protein